MPGFVEIPKEKNLTFDGALTIKLRVNEPTNKIELNSIKLGLPSGLSDYAILEDSQVAVSQLKDLVQSEKITIFGKFMKNEAFIFTAPSELL